MMNRRRGSDQIGSDAGDSDGGGGPDRPWSWTYGRYDDGGDRSEYMHMMVMWWWNRNRSYNE